MGSAVKSVVKNPVKAAVSTLDPLNLSGKGAITPIKGLGGIAGGAIDALTGKVNTPTGYNPNAEPFQNTGRQAELQEILRNRALGLREDPTSVAQQQLKTATDRTRQQIAGMVGGQRTNQGLALRQAFKAQAAAGQEAAGQAANLRAQEMANAQALYSQDLLREQQAKQNLEGMRSGIAGATQQLQFQSNLNRQQATAGLIGGLANAGATIFFDSDEELKKDIKKANPKDLEEFASKLKASKFKYKSPNGESYQEGEITGVMAQDLEKSKLGKSMVMDSPKGKMVDLKKAVPATMAAVSEIMKRLKKLEEKKES